MSDRPAGQSEGYAYQRTTDNGVTWYPASIADAAIKVNGSRVLGFFCAQPTLAPDGSYFIAYMQNQPAVGEQRIRFVRGVDDNSVPTQPKVNFSSLPGDPVVILNRGDCTTAIPNCYIGGVETVPSLVADPTDGNRMFVVYHDANEPGGADIDIYCVTLTH